MPKTYSSVEAFKEYSARIGYASDYREAMGVVQSAFSCLALTNEQVRELQSLAWRKSQDGRNGRVSMRIHVKGGATFEVADRKEADCIRMSMRQYANLLIDGERKAAERKRIEIMQRGKCVSLLCCKVDGFE